MPTRYKIRWWIYLLAVLFGLIPIAASVYSLVTKDPEVPKSAAWAEMIIGAGVLVVLVIYVMIKRRGV